MKVWAWCFVYTCAREATKEACIGACPGSSICGRLAKGMQPFYIAYPYSGLPVHGALLPAATMYSLFYHPRLQHLPDFPCTTNILLT